MIRIPTFDTIWLHDINTIDKFESFLDKFERKSYW
jgi:hypothetical protein